MRNRQSQNEHLLDCVKRAETRHHRAEVDRRLAAFKAHEYGAGKLCEEVAALQGCLATLFDPTDKQECELHDVLMGFLEDLNELAFDALGRSQDVTRAAEALLNYHDAKVVMVAET